MYPVMWRFRVTRNLSYCLVRSVLYGTGCSELSPVKFGSFVLSELWWLRRRVQSNAANSDAFGHTAERADREVRANDSDSQ